jgi:ribonuclease HI
MRFRSDPVWVLVDDDGRPVLDGGGRAEMKYREGDTKSYRPGPSNLTPITGADSSGQPLGSSLGQAIDTPRKPRKFVAEVSAGIEGPRDPAALEVWTDGACSGNPGPMGIGIVVIDGGWRGEIAAYLGVGTNNIAELVAIERGVEASLERIGTTARRVRVYTDSSYAIGLLSKGWKAKANQDLVQRIRRQLAAFPAALEFVKVAGHAGIPENERCDELARIAVERRQ